MCLIAAITVWLAMPALAASTEVNAQKTAATVLVDGKEVAFDAYNIDGNNYFKLRDVANVRVIKIIETNYYDVMIDGADTLGWLTGFEVSTVF